MTPTTFDPRLGPPPPSAMEWVACYGCGGTSRSPFTTAEDDLTGKPGTFTFVRCRDCDLVYQCPRPDAAHVRPYYDEDYISHRRRTDWGPLTPLVERAMSTHDRRKVALVRAHAPLGPGSAALDVGCGSGTFLARLRAETGARVTGVDWVDLRHLPWMKDVDFRCGRFDAQAFDRRFDLITLWHFLEHDYDPRRTLAATRDLLAPDGRLVVEVPRLDSTTWRLFRGRWPGLQAPQHTVLFTRETLLRFVEEAGLEVVAWNPWGAMPAYFYLFCGVAFGLLRGRGLDVGRWLAPYFAGQALLWPVLLLEKHLNLAMQTVVARRRG